jgi:hypothetical protein
MNTQDQQRITGTHTLEIMARTNTSIATMIRNRTITGIEDFPSFTQMPQGTNTSGFGSRKSIDNNT